MSRRENKKKSKAPVIVLLLFILIIVGGIVGAFSWYTSQIKGVTTTENKVVFEVEEGQTYNQIIAKLKEKNLIRNETAMKIYSKLNWTPVVKAGPYALDSSWNVEKIIDTLNAGPDSTLTSISVTFLEGKNMRWIAKQIADKTNNTEDDVYAKLKDEEYLNKIINKYWFLTDEIKNQDIYYSLEGYLFPDTYQLDSKDASVEDIFGMMLDQMEKKLEKYKSAIQGQTKYSVHYILTMASIVEAEASNASDRAGVAGVFYNRLSKNMTLGSDVTTYYGIKVDMSERDLKVSELKAINAYNTRSADMAGKLPVSPICSVSTESIEAAINPTSTDNLFFVADKNGKVYYAKTDAEHQANIKKLKDSGNWYTYDN